MLVTILSTPRQIFPSIQMSEGQCLLLPVSGHAYVVGKMSDGLVLPMLKQAGGGGGSTSGGQWGEQEGTAQVHGRCQAAIGPPDASLHWHGA